MSDFHWLTDEPLACLAPFRPRSHGRGSMAGGASDLTIKRHAVTDTEGRPLRGLGAMGHRTDP